jgi:hypothetical protein
MRAFFGLATLAIAVAPAFAGHNADSTIWVTDTRGPCDSGWVVVFPTGTSDYYGVSHNVVAGIPDSEDVAQGMPLTGVSVSVADFASGRTYPTVGVYLSVDPAQTQPDLSTPIVQTFSPVHGSPVLFTYVGFETAEGAIPTGTTRVHAVAQLPPGDSGLLGIGADSTVGQGTSSFTSDGYATPAIIASFIDAGINPGQDNSATTSCKSGDRKPHGRLRASNLRQGIAEGDKLTTTVKAGDTLNLAFFGSKSGDKLRLYFNVSPCTPAVALGPVLPTAADGDGDGTYVRINATWPLGFGGQTFRFSAVWGNPACSNPGVGFTNCVTIVTDPDPTFGLCDDGTVESGWVNTFPTGPSDYFNNNVGDGTGQNGVVALNVCVLDFAGLFTALPGVGLSPAAYGVDGSGNTPDLALALAVVAPYTFPALHFGTTSLSYISHPVAVPGTSLGADMHVWAQLPPGDSGTVGIGGDTTAPNGCSFWNADSYVTPAISAFYANWGMRAITN